MSGSQMNEYELHAYFDGELPEAGRAGIEAYLRDNPDKRAQLDSWALQGEELRKSFPVQPVPASIAMPRPRRGAWQALAAGVVIAALGVGGGWGLRGAFVPPVADSPVQMAINAHATFVNEVVHPVEVQATREEHLLKWLSNRLGSNIKAPDLAREGYALLGGRLLPNMDEEAAQFMYENQSGARITLYITPTPQSAQTAFQFLAMDGYQAFYWVDTDISYALVGQTSKDQLRALAIDVYEQLI